MDGKAAPNGVATIEDRILRITGYYGYYPGYSSQKSKAGPPCLSPVRVCVCVCVRGSGRAPHKMSPAAGAPGGSLPPPPRCPLRGGGRAGGSAAGSSRGWWATRYRGSPPQPPKWPPRSWGSPSGLCVCVAGGGTSRGFASQLRCPRRHPAASAREGCGVLLLSVVSLFFPFFFWVFYPPPSHPAALQTPAVRFGSLEGSAKFRCLWGPPPFGPFNLKTPNIHLPPPKSPN